jgi:hypothetical protein
MAQKMLRLEHSPCALCVPVNGRNMHQPRRPHTGSHMEPLTKMQGELAGLVPARGTMRSMGGTVRHLSGSWVLAAVASVVGCGNDKTPSTQQQAPAPAIEAKPAAEATYQFPGSSTRYSKGPDDVPTVPKDPNRAAETVLAGPTVLEGGNPGDLSKIDFHETPTRGQPKTPVACTRITQTFDLTKLVPTGPSAFAAAWALESARASAPALVVHLRGMGDGPVMADVGSVHRVSPIVVQLDPRPLTWRDARPTVARADGFTTFHFPPSPNGFNVSFVGGNMAPHGFSAVGAAIALVTDTACEQIVRSEVVLTIPKTAAPLAFGQATLGNLLGQLDSDSNGDGEADSWQVTFTGMTQTAGILEP